MPAINSRDASTTTVASGRAGRWKRKTASAVDALFYLSILLFIGRAIQGNILFLYGAVAAGMAVFAYYAVSNHAARPRFWLLLALFACGYFTSLARNGLSDGWLFMPLFIASAGLAWRIHLRKVDYRFATALFYGVAADFLIEYYVLGRYPHSIFANSGNHISVTFISLAALVYIAATVNQRQKTILPALVTFVISVLSLGVGGIISSGLLLIGVLLYLIAMIPRYRTAAIFVSIGFGLVIMLKMDAISASVERRSAEFYLEGGDLATKLDPGMVLSGNDRYQIWGDYLGEMNAEKLILGTPLNVPHYGYTNLHSSYFLLHARTGVWFFPIMAVLLVSMIGLIRRDPLLFICLLAIVVRAYSDTVYLGIGSYDWILLYLAVFAVRHRARTQQAGRSVGHVRARYSTPQPEPGLGAVHGL